MKGEKDHDQPHATPSPRKVKKRHRWLRRIGIVLIFLIVILGIGRAFMPQLVRDYVNRTIDRNPLYSGRIGDVEINLLHGAYAILDVRLNKTSGNVPVPLFSSKRIDFTVQWSALIHGRIVTRVTMEEPELNFVDSPSEGESQTGGGGPWMQMLSDLSPFTINSATLNNGSIHFRTYKSQKPVDVYLSQVQASIDNLSNIRNDTNPLLATVNVKGLVMDQAKMELKVTLDPFSYRPTFHMGLRLLGLDVTKINDLALTYGKFDFKRGWFDLVVEADSKEGQITGYVKPLFRNLKVFSLRQDIKEDNMLEFFWQALLGAVTGIFKNQPHDQFGTLIPFTADANGTTSTEMLTTIGNVLRNAFIRAYLPRLQSGQEEIDGLKFDPPEITDPISGSPIEQ